MKISSHETGYTKTIERILFTRGSYKKVKVPANCTIIEHPKGVILYDTGYSKEFFEESKKFPYSIYNIITPVTITKPIAETLKEKGVSPEEVTHIIISHYHGDHISGIKNFPNAKYISTRESYDSIKDLSGIAALKKAFIPGLLPDNFKQNLSFAEDNRIKLEKKYHPFTEGYDLMNDGSIIGISLPGHAAGQMGLIIENDIFIADACYKKEIYSKEESSSKITKLLHEDWNAYSNTIDKLHKLHNKGIFNIIGSHIKLK